MQKRSPFQTCYTISPTKGSSWIKDRRNRTEGQSFHHRKPSLRAGIYFGWTSGGSERFLRSPFSPATSPRTVRVRTHRCPHWRHLLAASTRPASDTHTHQHTQESSAPLDQPSSKTEVRNFFQQEHKRLPQQGSVARETPASHSARLSKGPSGVSPQRAGPPGNSLNFQGGDVRHRPQPQTRRAPREVRAQPAPPRLPQPARDALSPQARPPGHRPPREAPAPPRPLLAASPHPTRPAAARLPPRPPPAGRRAAPPSRGAPQARPSPAAPPPAPAPPALTRSSRRDAAPSGPTDPHQPKSPVARGPHPVSGECGRARTRPQPGPATRAPRRPEPPPSAPDSPGHPAHGSPHRGYF